MNLLIVIEANISPSYDSPEQSFEIRGHLVDEDGQKEAIAYIGHSGSITEHENSYTVRQAIQSIASQARKMLKERLTNEKIEENS